MSIAIAGHARTLRNSDGMRPDRERWMGLSPASEANRAEGVTKSS
ncbi:hypothetical protein [Acetobacter nitrogenifigens]|nr:hypothetical protein [Acetobacter nitrogenifigens]